MLPNGQIKGVINSSKGFVNSVIDLKFLPEPISKN